jgi:hypothetical protein
MGCHNRILDVDNFSPLACNLFRSALQLVLHHVTRTIYGSIQTHCISMITDVLILYYN